MTRTAQSAPGRCFHTKPGADRLTRRRLMNDHSSPQPAPHDPLAVLRGHFPGWEAWRGVSGLLYVRRRMSSPPVVFRGYTAASTWPLAALHAQPQRVLRAFEPRETPAPDGSADSPVRR